MANEILINQGGLYRCCLASVSKHSRTLRVRAGDIYQCPYCNEEMELVEEGQDLCWQWLKRGENDTNTNSN